MIKPSPPKIIHGEAFDKVCEMLNRLHHVRCTGWDLRILAVIWDYRTMCKILTVQVLLKLEYEARNVVLVEHAKPSS